MRNSLTLIRINPVLQFGQQILAAILLIYHFLIWAVDESLLQLALSFILYGLFLLWQPLWHKEARITRLPIIVVGIVFIFLTYSFPNESLLFFGLILAGLIGSRLLSQTAFRSFDLLALLILTLEMAVGLIPDTFRQIQLPALFAEYMQTVILIPVLLFFFAPNPDHQRQGRSQVDLMHGLLAATLLFIVLLGGIVINLLYGVDYVDGLLLTVFIVATLTIGISWFWNPGIGYSGIGVLWNRYAMTIGGPFETWINTLTTLIEERYLTPTEYLEAACEHLVENDWLNAIEWQFENFRIRAGDKTGPHLTHDLDDKVSVVIYFKADPGAALEQHTILLIRMAYQFYLAKLNQEKVRAQEHFATIHHTGARLTHDIKNILQSIKTSIDILDMEGEDTQSQILLQGNLKQIGERLSSTLNKLRAPRLNTQVQLVDCEQWVERIGKQHNANTRMTFHSDIDNNIPVPVDLFDSVAENLINNALKKESATQIDVRLMSSRDIIVLSICDDGDAIPAEIEESLFAQPVSSGSGMGIGLYQSAIMANAFNYELELSQNERGRVCFNLFQHQSE
ncbi:MAG: HAMP domain-containing sensor histidine kinase [Gammaproteobacteria bacterium]|nr:HAMP domain-containing sensor histidine kinase [Gammaproteobacteria bacterium]